MDKTEINLRDLYNKIPDEIFEMVSDLVHLLKDIDENEEFEINDLGKL